MHGAQAQAITLKDPLLHYLDEFEVFLLLICVILLQVVRIVTTSKRRFAHKSDAEILNSLKGGFQLRRGF